jgi:pimeloyl-ACP methyl ester carboxylesterase
VAAPTAAPAAEPTAEPTAAPTEAAAATSAGANAFEPVACDTLGVAPELAAVAECGYVTVPENRAAGTDKTIQLAVVRVPSTAAAPGAPVILGTGGPGAAGLQGATGKGGSTFMQTHAAILADRDWVFFTQRGSPQAKPELSCPAYNNVPLEAATNGWSAEERLAQGKAAMQVCLDDFAAQGVDLTGYNSVENAADIDAIRQALGYDKIVYYGESYGTLLGQYLLRAHPEILEAIILDGIAPATATRWTDVTKINESFVRVFDACAADEACHAAYPDPEGALARALATLKANPASYTLDAGNGITVPLQVDDVLAMNALFLNLYISGGYAQVPAIVYQLSEGDYSALASTLPLYYANSSTARVMHMAIACSDDPIASLDEVNLDVPEIYKALILDDSESYATICPMIGVPHMPDSSDALVESDVPALLLQGGLDPATPVSGGDNVATGLLNSYNIVVPAGSHIQSGNPCILGMMAAFMRDPQAEPDTSCIDPKVPFAVPFAATVTSPDGSTALTMTLPATFMPYPGGA